jgi:hypothetical protein
MATSYNPAASLVAGNGFLRLQFFTAAPEMRDKVVIDHNLMCSSAGITFVGAQMLRLICVRFWSLYDNRIQDALQLSNIMPIRPGDEDRERDAMLFQQEMTVASSFFPGPSGSDQSPLVP